MLRLERKEKLIVPFNFCKKRKENPFASIVTTTWGRKQNALFVVSLSLFWWVDVKLDARKY